MAGADSLSPPLPQAGLAVLSRAALSRRAVQEGRAGVPCAPRLSPGGEICFFRSLQVGRWVPRPASLTSPVKWV